MDWNEKRCLNPSVISAECEAVPEEVDYDASRLTVLNQHIQSLIDEHIILSGSYCLWRKGKVFADAAIGNFACEWQGKGSDPEKITNCVEKSELVLDEHFEQGYDTMLSREFGGIDLSGGQWQRVAIARGLYRDSKFMLLDEPTSAIDPIEEGILYRKFRKMVEGKMGILVTHRLGSAKIADRIIVLNKGRLVEQGTHGELLQKNGYYSELYREQAKWYAAK